VKGEIVVLVDRGGKQVASAEDLDAALRSALGTMRVKEAAEAVSKALGLPRREVYQAALRLAGEK
jgi:16S rRNA (cytidine1402-2'-O)-methyltransferase